MMVGSEPVSITVTSTADVEATHRQSGSGTTDAKGQGSTVPDVGVVALTQELNNSRHLSVVAEHDESECSDGCPTDVIIGV
jgi:hypothetical protein